MTICLAAIATETLADNTERQVIVTASDRMITLDGRVEYIWAEQTKTFWFSDSIMAMSADDPDQVLEICRRAARALDGKQLTVARVAAKVTQKFREHRNRRNEWRILSPQGLTFETLAAKERQLDPATFRTLRERLDDAVLAATMIIAGVDGSAAHIFLVDDPGDFVPCDAEGFAAIGLGREHAESVFTESHYTHRTPWTEAVLLAYLAKKRAESAPGVGEDTDLYWIKPEGYAYIEPTDDLMRELARVRRARDRQMRRAVEAGHQRLRGLIENVPLRVDC